METYDVVVVGARCGGAPAARLLAGQGLRVLLLDRGARGSDKLSTLYVHQPGVAFLRAWGVLDEVRATGAPPITGLTYRVRDVVLHAPGPSVGGGNEAYAPRRGDLDAILCRAAEAAGVDVVHEASVTELVHERARPAGVRYRKAGRWHEARADLVVGADGLRSTVAGLVPAESYAVHPKLSCCVYGYWTGLDAGFEQHQGDGLWVGVIPTAGAHVVACYFRQSEFARVRIDVEGAHERCLRAAAPSVAERLAGAERVGRLIGMGDQQNYFRTASGPGWALVGDAGHHKDSLTARGITDAFVQADLLARAVAEAGSLRPARLDAHLAAYARERDRRMMPFYRSTLAVARLDVEAERLAELRHIAASPELCARYGAAVAGALTPEEYRLHDAALAP
ncbi:NAD(P)/FAD-dependent oxidoreductase [Streptomyces sp. NPDC059402]|uniref:NAD(P)/FAD-dependent oxidoreductase n=1 Tax=Streptomyces sp. NPDC059402 TaxID=3346822 RepID=UPI0036C62EC3